MWVNFCYLDKDGMRIKENDKFQDLEPGQITVLLNNKHILYRVNNQVIKTTVEDSQAHLYDNDNTPEIDIYLKELLN